MWALAPEAGRALLVMVSIVGVTIAGSGTVFARDDAAQQAFVEKHLCAVMSRLELVRTAKAIAGRPKHKNRYLIASPAFIRDRYVQCIFIEGENRMLCEAASGAYAERRGIPRHSVISGEGVADLAELGFELPDQNGNYQKFVGVTAAGSLRSVAELMLTALYRGYGLRPDASIVLEGPLLPEHVPDSVSCASIG